MADSLQRRINSTGPDNFSECVMTTGPRSEVMKSFRCELQDVMTGLLDSTVMQILQLVQKDFLDKLKQNEQEIHRLHSKLQMQASHPQTGDGRTEAEEGTFQEQTGIEVEHHDTETETNMSTDKTNLRQELTENEGNPEEDQDIIQLSNRGNAESFAEAAEAEMVRETGSETWDRSDTAIIARSINGGGQTGNEDQRMREGKKASSKRKRLRVRVKSERTDDDDPVNEKMSSADEVVVLKLEDSPRPEGCEAREDSEASGGAELQVLLLEDHDKLCNGNEGSVRHLHELKHPTPLNESTTQQHPIESRSSEGIKTNRCISPIATYNGHAEVSKEYLAKAKVALTKMEDLPDRGWVLLDPLTGRFCIKDELDFKPEMIEMDEQEDSAEEGTSSAPVRSGARSMETAIQRTTTNSTQTDAQITVIITEDGSDKINQSLASAEGGEQNRVVTRSSIANRASTSNTKTSETNDAQSTRGYVTRSTGNVVSDRTEGDESGASCHTGSTPGKKATSDSENGDVRLSKEVLIVCRKIQNENSKKHSTLKVKASKASTRKKSHTDKTSSKNTGKAKKQSHNLETDRVYRSGQFIISQGILAKSQNEVALKSSGQIYSAKVKVSNASEQGFKVKKEFHPKGKVFECKHCSKTFSDIKNLKKHWQYHSANKKHICSDCGKGFVYECHLRIHMQSHTNDRPFQCNQCGKRFTYRSNLKYHQLYHTGEKPHVCLQCGMAFSRRGHLVMHITCHSGLRPYCCSHCGKTFTAKGGLTRHEQIHKKKK